MRTTRIPQIPSMAVKDEGELLYTTLVGMIMAAIFATRLHDDVERTLTNLAPEGTSYPFAAHTRPSAAKFASAVAGFCLGVFCYTLIGVLRWSLIRKLLTYRNWLKQPKSIKTKLWALSLKALMPNKKMLTSFQHVLPKYPLPNLSDTCKRTLEVFEPLMSEDEFEEFKKDLKDFERKEGPKLHATLVKRYHSEENWVSDLWDKFAYFSQRTPILVNTSIGTQSAMNVLDLESVVGVKPAGRAASLTYGYLTFWEGVKNNTLHSIMVMDLVPICAARYRFLMGCTRTPGVQFDDLKLYEDSRHIIVIRKGVMYRLDVYFTLPSGESRILPAEEMQRQIESILTQTADMTESAQNPSVFTAQKRTQWAEDREKLQAHKLNSASLQDVESAILHIVMEEGSPETLTDEACVTLCSNGYNLWCDKSITLRVFENSRCGMHFEHATADATLYGRLLEFVWDFAKYDSRGNAVSGGDDPLIMPRLVYLPEKLEWDLSEFESVLPTYLKNVDDLCNGVDVKVIKLRKGKGEMKKCRVSPDGLVQMSLQLAFYRMHKKTPKTYESASTRFFKFGRTETIRTVSKASVAFTKAMDDPSKTSIEKAKLCKDAINHQHRYKLDAMNGEACDRHIFGLYIAAKMAGLTPKIFQNKHLLSPDQLSTSQSPYAFDSTITKRALLYPTGGAFGPQRPDGYGIYYLFLADNAMTIHITSFRSCPETDSEKMGEEIVKAIEDIKSVLSAKK